MLMRAFAPEGKIFSCGFQKFMISIRHPASTRGAYASSRTWGGLRWTQHMSRDERHVLRTTKACGPGTPGLVSSFAGWLAGRR
jgi:hypothetical protein